MGHVQFPGSMLWLQVNPAGSLCREPRVPCKALQPRPSSMMRVQPTQYTDTVGDPQDLARTNCGFVSRTDPLVQENAKYAEVESWCDHQKPFDWAATCFGLCRGILLISRSRVQTQARVAVSFTTRNYVFVRCFAAMDC